MLVNTVIVGAGHAGLCMSGVLSQRNVSHVVLEKGRTLQQWRSRRWAAFKMNTPTKLNALFGDLLGEFHGDMPGMTLADTLERWDRAIAAQALPIREHVNVVSVRKVADVFEIVAKCADTGEEVRYTARNVVSCVGDFQTPKTPEWAAQLPGSITQLGIGTYTSPEDVQDGGGVLVVGGAQAGIQLVEDLVNGAKHKVWWATSKVAGCFRMHRQADIFEWFERMGMLTMPSKSMPDQSARYNALPITGNDHAVSHHSLARQGVTLLGRLTGTTDQGVVEVDSESLAVNLAHAKQSYDGLVGAVEEYVTAHGGDDAFPPFVPEPEWQGSDTVYPSPSQLDLAANNIHTVVWATGWDADFSWLDVPHVKEEHFGKLGRPLECTVPDCPGLFFVGHPWLRSLMSANLCGMVDDATFVADHLRD